jgi:quercetin dioxygenase-like cupin family protein
MSVQTQEAAPKAPRGSSLEFPDGTVYVITEPAERSGGQMFRMEVVLVADAGVPPPHVHPHQHEEFEVLEGALELRVGGQWHNLIAGQSAEVKPGEPHEFRNSSGAVARVRTTFRPALSFQAYIERVHQLIVSGKLKGPGDPKSLLYLSMLFREHRDTVSAVGTPQRIAMTVMSSVGRLLGLQLPPTTRGPGGNDAPVAKRHGQGELAEAGPRVAWRTIATTSIAALAASLAMVLGLRELGQAVFDLPDHLAPLSTSALIPATVLPVLGNSLGFFISFSLKPSRYSMPLFLGLGAVMTIVGLLLSLTQLPAAAGTGTIITAIAVSVAPVVMTVSALLLRLRGTGWRRADGRPPVSS